MNYLYVKYIPLCSANFPYGRSINVLLLVDLVLFFRQGDSDFRLGVWEKHASWPDRYWEVILLSLIPWEPKHSYQKVEIGSWDWRSHHSDPPPPPAPILQEHLSVSLREQLPSNMGSIITGDDRPICRTPLSPERSTGATTTHNNTLRKHRIQKGQCLRGELTLFKALITLLH